MRILHCFTDIGGNASGLARTQAMMRAHFNDWREAQQGRRNHTAALLEIASLRDQHREDVEQRYIEMFLRLRQYMRDGIAEGSIRKEVEATSATLNLGASSAPTPRRARWRTSSPRSARSASWK